MAGKAKKKTAGKGKAAPKQAKAAAKASAKAKPKGKPKGKINAKAKAAKKPAVKAKAAAKKTKPVQAKAAAKKPVQAKPAAKAKPSKPDTGLLQTEILDMARTVYGDRSDAELLAFDPNSVDEMDPATFYEMVAEKYGVEGDSSNQNFAGFGGPLAHMIAFVGSRWDGKTRRDAPMPPREWLDEFVHPATERVPEQAEPQDEPLLD